MKSCDSEFETNLEETNEVNSSESLTIAKHHSDHEPRAMLW